MTRLLQSGAVIFLAMLISGCSLPLHVALYNESGKDIEVSFNDESHQRAEVEIRNSSMKEITALFEDEFVVQSGNELVTFKRQDVPEDFVENVGAWPFFKRKVQVAMRQDGCIYLKVMPLAEAQPEGFPACGVRK